jgi:hypothetical protein
LGNEKDSEAEPRRRGLYLEMPFADGAIDGSRGANLPTMQQSLWISTSTYEAAHWGLAHVLDPYDPQFARGFGGRLLAGVADFALTTLPFGLAWQHEEWHRAVLKSYGVDSYDAVYDFDLLASTISVDHVDDRGLARIKSERNADIVRMGTAGIEASYELATNLERVHVFYEPRTWPSIAIGLLYMSNTFYMLTCADPDSDREVEEWDRSSTPYHRRDFTGYDCTGWTYDLTHPNEPYTARGPHPSGYGIRRYRRWADLDERGRSYLEQQAALSFLNFIDPMMIGFEPFSVFNAKVTGHVRHMPTSFGNAINLDVLMHRERDQLNVMASVQSFFNHASYFPGVALELHRFPVPAMLDRPTWLGAKANVWMQPDAQSFTTTTMAPGGLLSLRMGYEATNALSPFVEVEGKSGGWVAGNVALGPSVAFRAGLSIWAR